MVMHVHKPMADTPDVIDPSNADAKSWGTLWIK